jgi:hypothetical protein
MQIDVAKLDGIIRKLEELKRLAADPELAQFLPHIVSNGNEVSAPLIKPQQVEPSAEPSQPTAMKTSKRGDIKRAVIAAAHKQPAEFSAYSLTTDMTNSGFRFTAVKPAIAVNDILRNSVNREVEVVSHGKGSSPTIYRSLKHKTLNGELVLEGKGD